MSSPKVQFPVTVKVKRDIVKVRRPGTQLGVGVLGDCTDDKGNKVPDALQGKWFCELALSRGLLFIDHTKEDQPHFTFHNPMDILVPVGDVKHGDVFVAKDGKSVSPDPVVENMTIEVDAHAVLPTDVVIK